MPVSRNGRAWFSMLVALLALLAFAPQAGATDYDEDYDEPVACSADDDHDEDECSDDESDGDEPRDKSDDDESDDEESDDDESEDDESDGDEPRDKPDVCFARGDREHWCSDEPKNEGPRDEPEMDEPKDEDVRSCEDGPVGRSADRSKKRDVHFEDGCLPQLVRRFVSRVWKFVGEVDYYEEGVLSMTLGKILNLPRKWRTQDDELLDQDASVLVSNRARVFENGERVSKDALEHANDVRVHGKLLRPGKWVEDEDGETVTTIRAKKVHITN